jgi:hypothetical protein
MFEKMLNVRFMGVDSDAQRTERTMLRRTYGDSGFSSDDSIGAYEMCTDEEQEMEEDPSSRIHSFMFPTASGERIIEHRFPAIPDGGERIRPIRSRSPEPMSAEAANRVRASRFRRVEQLDELDSNGQDIEPVITIESTMGSSMPILIPARLHRLEEMALVDFPEPEANVSETPAR